MIYPDGSRYVGDWINGQRHGKGTYYYANGDTYEGDWNEGRREGNGHYIYKRLNMQYKGKSVFQRVFVRTAQPLLSVHSRDLLYGRLVGLTAR